MILEKWLSFDDVLLQPQFSSIKSRADVDTSQIFCGINLTNPIISSNMDTVSSSSMAQAMVDCGGLSTLHRFQSIEDNVKQFLNSPKQTIGSFGLGNSELERAKALYDANCGRLLLDVAHAASMEAVNQIKKLRELVSSDTYIIVGNFANSRCIEDFVYHLGNRFEIDAVKTGIGPGSACTTRVVTGSGAPLFSSIESCVRSGFPVIADGGIRNSGDYSKALAIGAHAVMCGRLLAGTDESPGEIISERYKKYRGSASRESYEVQGKIAQHRAAEGESYLIPYVGSVASVLSEMEAGLRSAMTYSGAKNLEEFRERAEFIEITSSGHRENFAHGKNV